eukprot:NODE_14138_length_1126_cov_4.520521.p6 GENE.NODE_14138_length_1126_cov_4.520521~~NODE_14138_length_1126_cov_4.520521.p6  ORF type:complete len:101 (+),score=25.83 NODE_14138_length_1126_cov_4.520521:561-863(+)
MRWATAAAFTRTFDALDSTRKTLHMPFLLFHDPGDKICAFSGSEALMRDAPSTDKTLRLCPGMLHSLLLNEPDMLCSEMLAWMGARLSRTPHLPAYHELA